MDAHTGPIRWGIAGTGGIATSFVTDFAKLNDGEIVAVGSRSAETANTFAATHGIDCAHGSYADLATDADVDIVYIAGIHPVHAEQAELFLAAGKHVLVEKPIALNQGEVDRMIAAASANDRFLMEALWMRFNPTHVEAFRRIHNGDIGEVRRITADFSFALPFDAGHRLYDRAKGGGALLDLGIYPLSMAWWALGQPASVTSTGHLAPTGVDDEVSLLCEWESGASALLTAALRLAGPMTARIEGTKGVVEFPLPAHASATVTLRRGPETETIAGDSPGLHHQVVEVHRCLRAGELESPRMPWATSRAMIAYCDEIRATLGVRYETD
jgi:predicted dehydrogenase